MRKPQIRQIDYRRVVAVMAVVMTMVIAQLPIRFPAAQAANVIVDLSSPNAVDLTVLGAQADDMAGSAIAIGDVNGDRIDDLVIGIPGSEGISGKLNSGEVRVFLGKPGLRGNFDLATAQADIRFFGADVNDFLGSNVGFFDINGDNIKDLIIAAPGADGLNNSRESAGELYVLFGGKGLASSSINFATTKPDLLIIGPRIGSQIGLSLAGGDINRDGNQDLIIGSPLGSFDANGPKTGVAYIVNGRTINPPFIIDLNNSISMQIDFALVGAADGDRFGNTVAVGDLNHDGNPDVIVGAPNATGAGGQPGAGAVIVFYGPLKVGPADFVVFGPSAGARLGEGVTIGDVDADRIDDLVMTAPGQAANGRASSGQAFIFYGSAPLIGQRDLSRSMADASIAGANAGDQFGGSLAVNTGTTAQFNAGPQVLLTDIDRDGFSDLLIGSPMATNPASRARNGEIFALLKGGNRFEQRDLQLKPADVTILGPTAVEQIGTRLAIGDINADGKPDLVIAAPTSSGPQGNRRNAGMVYVISNFNLNANGNNQPPMINPVSAQTVGEGGVVTVDISAIDPDGQVTLSVDRPPTPSFVTFQDNGGGRGRITIAPPTGSQGSYVITLRATDNGQPPLSVSLDVALNVTPPSPNIANAIFDGKSLTLTGSRFGSNPRVLINGVDQSKRIKSKSDTSIFLKGKSKKLGLNPGSNTIQVIDANGVASNVVTVNI